MKITNRRGAALLVILVSGGSIFLICLCLTVAVLGIRQTGVRSLRTSPTPGSAFALPRESTPTPITPPAIVIQVDPSKDEQTRILSAIYQKVNPSVVNITVRQKAPAEMGGEEGSFIEGQGSGFVWDKQGYIVTNDHVVTGATEVDVTFWNDVLVAATVVGVDPDSDLAVVKVDVGQEELIPAELGDSDTVEVGARAIAIGNPFGLEGTLTMGIISAVGRSIPSMGGFQIPEAIQTDAAINPGNSGGPLLDQAGRVIGINAQIRSDVRANSGVGFAIPINLVQRVVPALIEKGSYEHPWLGIAGTVVSPSMARDLDLPVERGIIIAEVISNSPAQRAGLRAGKRTVTYKGYPVQVGGDIIVQIDGQELRNFDDLLIYLSRKTSPGQKVTLGIVRDGKPITVSVALGARPTSTP
jgi:2-alkenal reductase